MKNIISMGVVCFIIKFVDAHKPRMRGGAAQSLETGATSIMGQNWKPSPDYDWHKRQGPMYHLKLPYQGSPFNVDYVAQGPFFSQIPSSAGTLLTDSSTQGFKHRKQLLDAHNYVRKMESQYAQSMTKLVWDFHLEAYAQQWGQYLCTSTGRYFAHSPNSEKGRPSWPWRMAQGENLYTTTGVRESNHDFSEVVYKMYDEKADFDWNSGKSKNGNPIGHYTQLVRAEATAVGCSVITNCRSTNDYRTFVACQYDYGNVGKQPYTLRASGEKSCQHCPNGFNCCEQGLCSGAFVTDELTPYSPATTGSNDWYGCKNHVRSCANTGALYSVTSFAADKNQLEFNPCICGRVDSESMPDLFDIDVKGYTWYRNHCYKADYGSSSMLETNRTMLLGGEEMPIKDIFIDEGPAASEGRLEQPKEISQEAVA
eukprot:GHVO01057717.1.p1 GENE.GHVO01057717.1~~GHVO01057717.1.p1  ORF type:complete len:426 (-),score=54.37 GHVO01057717.1:122-1399(-)